MNYKYVRIQGREDSYITKYPKGIFSLCWNLVNDGVMEQSENDLFISIDEWFKCNLPEPEPCVNREKVITFFKCDSAKEMYSKLITAMILFYKYIRSYYVVYTNFVFTIVYEDEFQIAFKVKDGEMIY